MEKCTITLFDEVNVHVDGISPLVRRELMSELSYELPYARYLPGAKLGRGTAKKEFFNLNGSTYFHCLGKVVEILDKHRVPIDLVDNRNEHDFQFPEIDENFFSSVKFGHGHHMEGKSIILREHQVNAVNTMLKNPHGLLLASTSSGKTMICAAMVKCAEQYGRTITIVPSTDLVQQTYDDYELVGLDCGMYYADRKDFHAQHVVTTWQSLNILKKDTKKGIIPITEEDLFSLFDGVVAFIVDEAHTSAAEALFDTLSAPGGPGASVPLRWAMTGTLPKEKIHAMKIKCNVGDVVYKITAKELMDKGVLSTCKINSVQLKETKSFKDYQAELKYLVSDRTRMEFIASMISDISTSGNTLVLVDRIEAGELLCEFLGIPVSEFVKGDTKKGARAESYGEIRWADNKILIATYGVASTGISISRLYNVVLIEPGKSFVRTIQSIGRGLRKAEDKDHVEIYDVYSSSKYSLRHSKERIKYYKEAEYPYEILKMNDWEK